MLRITRADSSEGKAARLRLEGRLVGEWVDLLEKTCGAAEEPLLLDLAAVSYASPEGFESLRRLQQRGVQCIHWSPFLGKLAEISWGISSASSEGGWSSS